MNCNIENIHHTNVILSTGIQERINEKVKQLHSVVPNVALETIKKLCKYIETYKSRRAPQLEGGKNDKDFANLKNLEKFTIEIDDKRNIFVHLGDINKGTFKTVTKSLHYNIAKVVAKLSTLILDTKIRKIAENEELYLNQLNGSKGIVKTYSIRYHKANSGCQEQIIIQKFYNEDLISLITSTKLSFSQKLNIAIQILDGLVTLHKKKIIHGDIKLENVLINSKIRQGKKLYKAALCDFQFSQTAESEYNILSGSPFYVSPEHLNALHCKEAFPGDIFDCNIKDSYKTDIWAMGVTLYTLFCMGYPIWKEHIKNYFNGTSSDNFHDTLTSMKESAESLEFIESIQVRLIIKKMLEYNPEMRIDVANALEEFKKIKPRKRS